MVKVRITFNNNSLYTASAYGGIAISTKEVELKGYDSFGDFTQRGIDDKWVNTGSGLYAAYSVVAIEEVEE